MRARFVTDTIIIIRKVPQSHMVVWGQEQAHTSHWTAQATSQHRAQHPYGFSRALRPFLIHCCQLTLMQMEGDRPVGQIQVQGEEIESESLVEKQQQAVISTLMASLKKLGLEKEKSDDVLKELHQMHRGEAEKRGRALKAAKER